MRTITLFFILLGTVGISGFFFEDIDATTYDYVWYGYPETGYFKAPIIYEVDTCDRSPPPLGCIMGSGEQKKIYVMFADKYAVYGCTNRAHEWYHLMGYEEWEIPKCTL